MGPAWHKEEHGFLSLPLLVRPNTVLAIGEDDTKPDYEYSRGVSFEVYALEDGRTASATVPNVDGSFAGEVSVTRSGSRLVATTTGRIHHWSLVLVGIAEARVISGGAISLAEKGVLIRADGDSMVLELP